MSQFPTDPNLASIFQDLTDRITALERKEVVNPTSVPIGVPLPTCWDEPIDDTWVYCDGQAISRDDYSEAFEVMGEKFGAGDGSTTFNVPNLVEKFPIGASGTIQIGAIGGAANVTLTAAEMPSHTHTITDSGHTHGLGSHTHSGSGLSTASNGGHFHMVTHGNQTNQVAISGTAAFGGSGNVIVSGSGLSTTFEGAHTHTISGTTGAASGNTSSATTGISISSAGSGTAFSILPPYQAFNWFVKVK